MLGYVEVSEASKLFAGPQDGSAEIAALRQGVVVRVIDEANDYYKVSYEGASGYLHRGVAIESTVEAFVRQLGSSRAPAPRAPTPPRAEPEAREEESSARVALQQPAPTPPFAKPEAMEEQPVGHAVAQASAGAASVQAPEEAQDEAREDDAPLQRDDDDGGRLRPRPEPPAPARPDPVRDVPRRFTALQTISGVLRVFGWLVLVVGITGSIVGAVLAGNIEDGSAATAVLTLGVGLVSSIIVGVVLLAYADLILLLVDIERNTRATALRVEELDYR